MTTSGDTSFPSRLTKIDELTRGDHPFLKAGDECLFFGDYLARKGWSFSETKKLVLNFKKPVERRGRLEWRYKIQAVNEVARAFSSNIGNAFGSITLVPVPPSKVRADPKYDDRMMDMLRALRAPPGMTPDVRELVVQTHPADACRAWQRKSPSTR